MKLYYFLIAACVLLCSSCNDFLELPSKTSLSTEVYYQSEDDCQQGLHGVYSLLRELYGGGSGAWVMGELRADNTTYAFNPNDRGTISAEFVKDFTEEANNPVPYHKYSTDYSIISNINYLLDGIDQPAMSEAARANIKGQALCLRAFAYLDLVQYFGSVPLHLHPVRSLSDVTAPLATVEEVYQQIIADASEAASLLPDKSHQEEGRVTQGTAYMLLGNVYINLKQWSQAEEALRQVSGYQLMDNYADIFDPAKKNNVESIFEIQYKEGNDGYASNFFYVFLPQPITAEETSAVTGITEIARIVEGYNIPTPDIIAAYEKGDVRMEASVGTLKAHGVTYPYIKKYSHAHAITGITDDNWPVYRYAETLLYLAEALNEQGKTAEAIGYLNQVRHRARLSDSKATTQAGVREAIMRERRVELAFENKRWLDLVHYGMAESVMRAYGDRVKADPRRYYFPEGYGVSPQSFTNIRLLFELPAQEAALTTYF